MKSTEIAQQINIDKEDVGFHKPQFRGLISFLSLCLQQQNTDNNSVCKTVFTSDSPIIGLLNDSLNERWQMYIHCNVALTSAFIFQVREEHHFLREDKQP